MSSSSLTLQSSSPFKSILDAALIEYKTKTGNDLTNNPLAKELQVCESAEAVLDIIQREAKAFDKFKDGDRRLMKWIGPSVDVLYAISGTLGQGIGIAFPSANVVSAGIGILLAAAKDVRASHDVLADLFERIQFFLKRLGVHTRIPPTNDMVEILVKITVEVLSILAIATKEVQQSRTKTYLKKLIGRTDIEDALRRLDNLTREEVRMAVAQVLKLLTALKDDTKKANGAVQLIANNLGELMDDVIEIKDGLSEIKEGVGEIKWSQIEQDVRKWFSSPDPSINYNLARKTYHEGTAAWFLGGDVFKEWELIGSLLWIHGKPGSGKSILCSAIIKRVISLRDAGHASLAYFFFDFRDKEKKQDINNFLTSLLIQLSAHSSPCRKIISCIYFAHGKGVQQPGLDVLTNCLHEMLLVTAQQPIYIIIDALDECPNVSGRPTPRAELLDLLEDLVSWHIPNLHLCITSRPEIDIKFVLEPLAYSAVSLHDQNGQKKDICDYVNAIVKSDRTMRGWRHEEKKLVVEVLSEKADGMFRWVVCQLEVLQHCFPSSIRQTLDQLPETLDDTYARVLSQIPQVNRANAHRMLQCLLVAARPLHVAELAELLAFDFEAAQETVPKYRTDWRPNDQVQAVLSICSSLITIANDQCSRVVQFSHFSVKEFLMSNRLTSSHGDFSRYQILPRSAHTILAKACLGVLLHLDDHVDSENVKGFPLAEYAAEHWVTHAQFKDVASHVKDGMVSLFDWDKPHFAAWVGIYDIDRPDRTHRELPKTPTPLYYSSLCGFSDLVQSLAIKHPQHVNAFGGQYGFPLRAALFKERFEIAVILLKHGAEQRRSLHEAIADVNIVRLLLNHGADVNFRQDDLRTPLHLAAWYAELEVARVLLEHNADVRSRDNMGKTPLHLLFGGSGRGDGDIPGLARLLLDHGAHVNTQDDDDNTPLHLASDRWMYKCARILLEHGADASAENKMGKTPWYLLFEDIYRDDEDIPHVVRLSLEHGADVNTRVTNEWTMLHAAAYWRRLETARVLLGCGANIGAETDHGETPLHIVSRGEYGSPEDGVGIARLLLNHGVDVHARDKDYDTALHWAAFKGRPEIAGLLLDHGASTNMENEWGETPLHLVSRCKYDTQKDIVNVVRLLLKRGVDVHAQDKNHDTALHSAAFRGRLGIVKVLLDHSSNVDTENDQRDSPLVYGLRVHSVLTNAQNKQHNTALHLACYSGRVEIAQMLLEHGANTSTKNEQGETPLHLVTRGNYDYQHQGVSIVLLLLARGVDVDTRKNSMATPLHLAAFRGRLKMTKVLLDHGANPHTKNDQGETPLHLAAFKGRLEIAKVLIDHGANVDEESDLGETPLHLVSRGEYDSQERGVHIAQLLLEHGADINPKEKDLTTPLHLARSFGRLEIAGVLLNYDVKRQQRTAEI